MTIEDHYRRDVIRLLSKFSTSFNDKPFKGPSKEDALSFLDSFCRSEASDPFDKLVGTRKYLYV
jgi:hypothetical protein